jgi:tRNA(fMet)-specific endonuclease VapC
MPRYLLDTSIVSAPILQTPVAQVVEKLKDLGHQCAIAAPVWHELQYGCQRLPAGKRRASLAAYLAQVVHTAFPILPYDEAAALKHALERARLEASGKSAPFVDGQIAAIALVHDLILVTRNARDFTRFAGLKIEDWASS